MQPEVVRSSAELWWNPPASVCVGVCMCECVRDSLRGSVKEGERGEGEEREPEIQSVCFSGTKCKQGGNKGWRHSREMTTRAEEKDDDNENEADDDEGGGLIRCLIEGGRVHQAGQLLRPSALFPIHPACDQMSFLAPPPTRRP